ncbi:MAG: molybdenum cofactor biosynthesis protein MoaB [Planctomycetales bacterium]|nr:molybdenum cofactor biosynthesis protein MoaB [Planctomycetales bacterium]
MSRPFQSPSADQHRRESPARVRCAVVTVSDTRLLENDSSGQAIVDALDQAGHAVVEREIVPDVPEQIEQIVRRLVSATEVDAILITGGTGIAARDQTPDTLVRLFTKELPGYGELLRMLSYQEIGPAAMLSRACGGLVEQTVLLTMPGSTAAVRLAMEKLIVPELGHLVSLAQS